MADEEQHPNPDETPDGDALDPEILEILRQADSGEDPSILDDAPLAKRDPLSDDPILPGADDENVEIGRGGVSDSLSQDELAELLADHESATSSTPETPAGTPKDHAPEAEAEAPAAAFDLNDFLSQGVLDTIIAESKGETPPQDATESESPPPTNNAELDELVRQLDERDTRAPEKDSAGSASQEELDALISSMDTTSEKTPESEAPQVSEESSEVLNQSDPDDLIGSMAEEAEAPAEQSPETEPAPAEPDPASATLNQDELDALIAGGGEDQPADTPAPAPAEPDPASATLNQDELDALIAGGGEDQPADTPAPAEAKGPLDQDDLDALITPNAESEPEEPAPAAEAEDDSGPLNQDDLDALINGMGQDSESEEAAPAAEAEEDSGPLSQNDLDALISGMSGNSPTKAAEGSEVASLTEDEIGELDTATSSPAAPASGVTQDDIDALLAGAIPGDTTEDAAPGTISQDMIDGLVSGAQEEETKEDVGSENLAAAGASTTGLLTQDDLDAIMEQARAQQQNRTSKASDAIAEAVNRAKEEKARQASEGPAAIPAAVGETEVHAEQKAAAPPRLAALKPLLRHAPRLAASLLAGILTGMGVFMTLDTLREEVPPMEAMGVGQVTRMRQAMSEADALMQAGDYPAARSVLESAIANAEPGPLVTDAIFAALEARCRAFRQADRDTPKFLALQGDLGTAVAEYPEHPRVPEALYWKAKLYEMDDRGLYAARDVYKRLLDQFPDMERRDVVLLDAAKLALDLPIPEPAEAFQKAQQLLNDFPGSPLSGKARLVMADAYAEVGQTDDARTLYLRTAQAHPGDALGAEAYLRIAKLAYDEGKYQTAINHLQTRLQSAPTTRGNDEVYLLLGRAQRRLGNTDAAESTLTDLLNFFPESETTPAAYIELSQVLFDAGDHAASLNRAQEAVVKYGYEPEVLRNQGQLLGITGDSLRAAEALVKADQAGTNDPALLLTAARHFRAAGRGDDAVATYDRLRRNYPVAPESITGAVEAATLLFDMNQTNEAIARLDEIERSTRGTDKHVETLAARLRMYDALGFYDRAIPVAERIATDASDPELLAQAAKAMADAARYAPGQHQDTLDLAVNVYQAMDRSRLADGSAHALTHSLGSALVQADPRRGLELLERAYFDYPEARTRETDLELLDAYLRAQRMNDARRMVMQLAAHVREHPAETPYLIDAATAWGNSLYETQDYRLAAEAYKMAVDAADLSRSPVLGNHTNPDWARFQRANALLNLDEFAQSRTLFEAIAAGNSEWAADAAVKARFAAMEESRRGFTTASAAQG